MLRNVHTHLIRRPWLIASVLVVCIGVGYLFALPVFAQDFGGALEQTSAVQQAAGVGTQNDLPTIIGRIINIVLGFLGIILLVIFLYAGFLYMTAGGKSEQVESAIAWMKNAIIGLVIIASAWAITSFILSWLAGGGLTGGGVVTPPSPYTGFAQSQAGSLGGGIIESHYPQRNATNIARNASIIVTFKVPIRISSIIADYNDNGTPDDRSDDTVTEGIQDDVVRIYRTDAGPEGRLVSSAVRVRFTDDRRTFVFRPIDPLGSSEVDVDYTVELMSGLNGVVTEQGVAAFSGAFSEGYKWSFQTGTFIDTTPPRIRSVYPAAGTQPDRNVIIHLVFTEAVDPTATTGLTTNGFSNIEVLAGGASVDGEFRISNEYRTIEFVPSDICGRNTCGEDIYCLPSGSPEMETIAHAATLDGSGPAGAFLAAGYDGVVDVASNSLDGNGDDATQGRGVDDYAWRFGLTDEINLDTPIVEFTLPGPQSSNVDPFNPIRVRFDSIVQGSSLNTDNVVIKPHEPDELNDSFWWSTAQSFLTDTNEVIERPDQVAAKSEALITHRMFAEEILYDPFLYSGIRNVYQNCFNPAESTACLGAPHCCNDIPSQTACDF